MEKNLRLFDIFDLFDVYLTRISLELNNSGVHLIVPMYRESVMKALWEASRRW